MFLFIKFWNHIGTQCSQADQVNQGWANTFCERPGSKYFQFFKHWGLRATLQLCHSVCHLETIHKQSGLVIYKNRYQAGCGPQDPWYKCLDFLKWVIFSNSSAIAFFNSQAVQAAFSSISNIFFMKTFYCNLNGMEE